MYPPGKTPSAPSESREGALRSSGLVEWLVEDGPMGNNNNDVWDWEGNNE